MCVHRKEVQEQWFLKAHATAKAITVLFHRHPSGGISEETVEKCFCWQLLETGFGCKRNIYWLCSRARIKVTAVLSYTNFSLFQHFLI